MITLTADFDKTISQDIYDDMIASLQFHQLSCTCGHSACLTVHGYYSRQLKAGLSSISLRICRVKCSFCGHTHALLPSSLVPYSQVSLPDQVDILMAFESGNLPFPVMERLPSIDENLVFSILHRYRRHWHQRLLSEGIPFLPLTQLVQRCFLSFGRQFLQIKRTPNLLFSGTT